MARPHAQSPAKSRSRFRAGERARADVKRRALRNLVMESREDRTLLITE